MQEGNTGMPIDEAIAYLVGRAVGEWLRGRLLAQANLRPTAPGRRGPPPRGMPTRRAMVVALVRESGRAWTAGEVGRTLGLGTHAASVHLARSCAAGLLHRVAAGRYAAA